MIGAKFIKEIAHSQSSVLVTTLGRNHVFKVGVQFLGLGYCTEQNTDGIPSFVHCSLLCNGIALFIKKVGVVRPNFGGSGLPPPRPVTRGVLGGS